MPRHRTGLDGLRVAFVSDLHAGTTMAWSYLEDIVTRINGLEPHLVLLGGDFVTDDTRPIDRLASVLSRLNASLGVFAVRGNHDMCCLPQLHAAFEKVGMKLLVNQGQRIHFASESLWLCGVDDLWRGRPDVGRAIAGRDPGEFTLLLSHNPDIIGRIPPGDVDLLLAGHTHGGQIRILGRAIVSNSRYGTKYLEGWNWDGPCPIYVTRGIGAVRAALRIGAPPEITLIELQPGAEICPLSAEAAQ
ncbi:MAG: metallophosphoesterase [Sphingomonadales bacterium]